MAPATADLETRWRRACTSARLAPAAALLDDLLARYREPHRRYHTLQHLAECFRHFDAAHDLAERPAEIDLALWFHDAIYDPRAQDNEERSAAWAREAITSAGRPDMAERVGRLILATRHDAPAPPGDAALLVDVDLAILGAPARRFDEYDEQVREEYAWVPDDLFRAGRCAVLSGFLARARIFATALFHERYEAAARANLARAIERWR